MKSNTDKTIEIFQWLEKFRKHRTGRDLSPIIDINKMLSDENYARKNFIQHYAYARANAPLSYKINALKTLKNLEQNSKSNPCDFFKERVEKMNAKANPFYDERFFKTNFSDILKIINEGNLSKAFKVLELKGLGSKIKTLFIRDMVYFSNSEKNITTIDELIFTQPIDIWIKLFIDEIVWPAFSYDKENANYLLLAKNYTNRWKDVERGLKILNICKQALVSPVLINHAIWLFSSRVVADTRHLKELVGKADISLFQKEADLVDEFL